MTQVRVEYITKKADGADYITDERWFTIGEDGDFATMEDLVAELDELVGLAMDRYEIEEIEEIEEI